MVVQFQMILHNLQFLLSMYVQWYLMINFLKMLGYDVFFSRRKIMRINTKIINKCQKHKSIFTLFVSLIFFSVHLNDKDHDKIRLLCDYQTIIILILSN